MWLVICEQIPNTSWSFSGSKKPPKPPSRKQAVKTTPTTLLTVNSQTPKCSKYWTSSFKNMYAVPNASSPKCTCLSSTTSLLVSANLARSRVNSIINTDLQPMSWKTLQFWKTWPLVKRKRKKKRRNRLKINTIMRKRARRKKLKKNKRQPKSSSTWTHWNLVAKNCKNLLYTWKSTLKTERTKTSISSQRTLFQNSNLWV